VGRVGAISETPVYSKSGELLYEPGEMASSEHESDAAYAAPPRIDMTFLNRGNSDIANCTIQPSDSAETKDLNPHRRES